MKRAQTTTLRPHSRSPRALSRRSLSQLGADEAARCVSLPACFAAEEEELAQAQLECEQQMLEQTRIVQAEIRAMEREVETIE